MKRIETLRSAIEDIYRAKYPTRDEWSDWLYEHHVFVVATYARELSEQLGVKNDLAEAAGMLHDIADAKMGRFSDTHAQESQHIARELLTQSGYTEDEIKKIVDDALENHSCRYGHMPQTIEGKILATADAKAHLATEFYDFFQGQLSSRKSLEENKKILEEKINRDFNDKIFFAEVRESLSDRFKELKRKFAIE